MPQQSDASAYAVGANAASALYLGATQIWTPPITVFNPATLDDFARAAGALGANWTSPWTNSTGTISITSTSGRTTGSSAGTVSSAAAFKTSFAANQDVALTVPVVDTTASVFVQVSARGSSSANNTTTSQYFLRVVPSSSAWSIRKSISGGASSTLVTLPTQAFASGDSLGLRVTGTTTTTLTAYYKASGGSWTQVGSSFDDTSSPITAAGFIGFVLQGTVNRGGVFAGGAA